MNIINITSVAFLFQLPKQQRTHCNSLCLILLLLRSQSELNKQLLELLIAVVDAELLETAQKHNGNEVKYIIKLHAKEEH